MTNREWLLNKMQNMSDEELANAINCNLGICHEELKGECLAVRCVKCYELWLKAEHKEKITLSEAERIILENIDKEYKWIARDKDGTIYICKEKPFKDEDIWQNGDGNITECFNHLFQFITWEDKQAYNIAELLKGE